MPVRTGRTNATMATTQVNMSLVGLILCMLASCSAYYIPGTYPREFAVKEDLPVEVNSLSSFDTELPYDYYSLPFCTPKEGVKRSTSSVNPGTILSGLKMYNSPYVFKMRVDATAQVVCEKVSAGALSMKQAQNLKHKIQNRYRVRMVLDNLPITTYDLEKGPTNVRPGFELGYTDGEHYYIFNHLVFNVLIHKTHGEFTRAAKSRYENLDLAARKLLSWPEGTPNEVVSALRARAARELAADKQTSETAAETALDGAPEADSEAQEMWMVVGFEVMPCSIKRTYGDKVTDVQCKPLGALDNPTPQVIEEGQDIIYTYDVYFEPSDVEWASRWDAYLRMPGGRVHWFSILNSLLVVMVMSVIVAVIFMRTVRRDLAKYEEILVDGSSSDSKEESGWKLVSGDVFRMPADPQGLAVQVGTGVQIFCTGVVTLMLAAVGFLSPASRGALLTSAIVLYLLLAITSGFAAVLIWGNLQRSYTGWTGICLKTACYFPGITMAVLTMMNIIISTTGTTGAIPFTMYFSLLAIWFVVSIPLTYVGGFLAFKTPLLHFPSRTHQIPRQIPPPPTPSNPYLLYVAAGILPFCTLFIELYFAMTSMWQGYFYYLFGFLFIVGLLTIIITLEVSILCTYVQLCAEDYQWWWASFHRGGSVAAYLFFYALLFLFNTLTTMHGLSILLYLAYMTVIILAVHICMGTVGFAASFAFVFAIFNAVKAD